VALALFVAACGDDDESDSASTSESTPAQTAPAPEEEASGNIVVVAQSEENLSTLVTAVGAARLAETLQSAGPFTVFAPTNEAFEAIPPQQLENLLKPANRDQLAEILTYHVVPGELTADMLSDGQELETVQGESLTVSIEGDSVMINDAMVVVPDVPASNGVVHVIDGVLTP
jgi:uncharacterized surface protein with fasciclin (FAS1) repeats